MIRKIGFALLGLGVLAIAWVGVTVVWGDPITSLYTRHEQSVLSHRLEAVEQTWRPGRAEQGPRRHAQPAADATATVLRARALAYRGQLHDGAPLGRIVIPKLDLRMVMVEGTSEKDLEKGPGHYNAASGLNTSLPGLDGVIGLAGHRTTFLHPFRHIDSLEPGDNIYLEMPYGTFRYQVYYHKIVSSTDWSILRKRPYEKLVLSACHPLYSASHRWVVFARLVGSARASV